MPANENCKYRGKVIPHGRSTLMADPCEACSCNTGKVTCTNKPCNDFPFSLSSAGLLPCSYRGTAILHGESLLIDECTTCYCDNSTVKCDITACAHTWCDEPLKLEGQCCEPCPYCKYTCQQ